VGLENSRDKSASEVQNEVENGNKETDDKRYELEQKPEHHLQKINDDIHGQIISFIFYTN